MEKLIRSLKILRKLATGREDPCVCQLFVNFDNFPKFENSDKRWQTCQHRDILHIVRHQLYDDDNNDDSNDDNNDDI